MATASNEGLLVAKPKKGIFETAEDISLYIVCRNNFHNSPCRVSAMDTSRLINGPAASAPTGPSLGSVINTYLLRTYINITETIPTRELR